MILSLPNLSSDYPLTERLVTQYQRDGHILLRTVATGDELAAYRPVILQARNKYGTEATPLEQFTCERGYTKVPGAVMAAGDATFHDGWTLHGAPGNSSHRTWEVMTIIWFADGTRVSPLDNANREKDLKRWLPGLRPGDLAASELNPLVFRR